MSCLYGILRSSFKEYYDIFFKNSKRNMKHNLEEKKRKLKPKQQ